MRPVRILGVILPLALSLSTVAVAADPTAEPKKKEPPYSLRVGGGIEGLALTLDKRLTAGPLWSATAGVRPLPWMGMELGYSGSTHEVDSDYLPVGDTGATSGADFVRHGGSFVATIIAPTPAVQPYGLVGVGIDSYNWRGSSNLALKDDTSGRVPFGAGVRTGAGAFDADLRFNYNVLFSQEFARLSKADKVGATWDLGLQVGGRF